MANRATGATTTKPSIGITTAAPTTTKQSTGTTKITTAFCG
jgi:hypothetical protein